MKKLFKFALDFLAAIALAIPKVVKWIKMVNEVIDDFQSKKEEEE